MRKHKSVPGLVLFLLYLPFSCLTAHAQYAPGDVIIADRGPQRGIGRVWRVTPQGQLYALATLGSSGQVAPAPDNRSVWVSGWMNQTPVLHSIAPDGSFTTLWIGWPDIRGIDIDDGGSLVFPNVFPPSIMKFRGGAFTTLYTNAAFATTPWASGLDSLSGDLVVVDGGHTIPGPLPCLGYGVYRASLPPRSGVSTVVAPNCNLRIWIISRGRIHDDPESGTLFASGGFGIYHLALGSPGTITGILLGANMYVSGLDRDPFDGQFVIASSGTINGVFRFDAKSRAFTTIMAFPGTTVQRPSSVTVAGSRHLCALDEPWPGRPYHLLVSSPTEPGAYYAVALSFGLRPGIHVGGGRKVYLNPDPLFFLSLTNTGIFSGFQGSLRATGEAVATLWIPNLPGLSGRRFFAAAVTVANRQIRTISETIGFTIR